MRRLFAVSGCEMISPARVWNVLETTELRDVAICMAQRADNLNEAPAQNSGTAGLTFDLYTSTRELDRSAWRSVVSPQDWSMQPDVLAVQERSLAEQARFWFAIVRDASGTPLACAAFCLFASDLVQAAPFWVRMPVGWLRRLQPRVFHSRLLFCGLPIPDGGNHLRIAETANRTAVLARIDAIMAKLAEEHRARLLIIKEFSGDEAAKFGALATLGYIRGAIPAMHRLKRAFPDFCTYRNALRSSYRRQIDASINKFRSLGVNVAHYSEPDEISTRFTDTVHRLYLNVLSRNDHRLETFPAEFFRDLPHALPGKVVLTLAHIDGRPVAFAFGVDTPEGYSNLYVGIDYTVNARGDLYFNIFYQSMAAAFERGAREIKLGATSNDFKSRLGATATESCFFARAASPLMHRLFTAFSATLFPELKSSKERQVFKSGATVEPPELNRRNYPPSGTNA